MTILDHHGKEKQRFLENCTQCGLCAEGCSILPYTDISEISPKIFRKGCLISWTADEQIVESPFGNERIIEVLQTVFMG